MGTRLAIGQVQVEWDLAAATQYDALRGLLRQLPGAGRSIGQDGAIGLTIQVLNEGLGRVRGDRLDPRWQASVGFALMAELMTWYGVPYSWDANYELAKVVFGVIAMEVFTEEFMQTEQWIHLWHSNLIGGFEVVSWELAGRHVYELDPDLAAALLPSRTELRGLRGADLRLPYPAVHVGFPPGLMQVKNRHGEVGHMLGATIVEDPCCLSSANMDSGDWIGPREWNGAVERGSARQFEGKRSWIIFLDGSMDSKTMFSVALPDERSVEEILDGIREPMQRDGDVRETALNEVFQFIMNAMVYATNVDGAARIGLLLAMEAIQRQVRTAGRDRRKKLRRRLADASMAPRVILGLLTTDRTVVEAPGDAVGPGHALTVRTLVTGHWRRQVCGPRNTERKLIWIRPFWRGPEGAPWGQHPRRVLRAQGLS